MTLIAISIFSLILIGIGYLITEKTAPYLLAGYNTMSKEEQDQVDLKPLLAFFKKFHINLRVSQAIIGFALYFFDYGNLLGVFIGTYSILRTHLFYNKKYSLSTKKTK